MEIDALNKHILGVLLDDSRLSYRQIAKKVGVSVATVMHRVNNLKKQDIIKKYTANLDYEKLGYDIVLLDITPANLEFAKKNRPDTPGQNHATIAVRCIRGRPLVCPTEIFCPGGITD